MNTAARMESTGIKDRIQLSQETADLLVAGGKGHWLKERADKVNAKGKGELTTYWLHVADKLGGSSTADSSSIGDDMTPLPDPNDYAEAQDEHASTEALRLLSDKSCRLIDWNVELLARILKQIIARRQAGQ